MLTVKYMWTKQLQLLTIHDLNVTRLLASSSIWEAACIFLHYGSFCTMVKVIVVEL